MTIRARLVAVASLLFALIASPSASVAADNAFIRINQLGYLTGSSARAYLMSKNAEAGATFQVLNAKGHVLSPGATSTFSPSISLRRQPAP